MEVDNGVKMKFFNIFLCQCGVGRTESIDRSNSSLLAVPSDIYRYSRSLEELVLKNNQVIKKELAEILFHNYSTVVTGDICNAVVF